MLRTRVDASPDAVGADLARQVDLYTRVDGRHFRVLRYHVHVVHERDVAHHWTSNTEKH